MAFSLPSWFLASLILLGSVSLGWSAGPPSELPPIGSGSISPLPPAVFASFGSLRFRVGEQRPHLCFSPDGKILAAGSRELSLYEVKTGRLVWLLPLHRGVTGVAFSRDGRWLASANSTSIRLWDLRTRQEHHRFDRQLTALSRDPVRLVFSPDSRWLAAVTGMKAELGLWEVSHGSRKFQRPLDKIECREIIAFTPDSKNILYINIADSPCVFDISTERHSRLSMVGVPPLLTCLASSSVNVVVGWEQTYRAVYVWDRLTNKQLHRIHCGDDLILSGAISSDGHFLATTHAHEIRIWDLRSGKEIRDARKQVAAESTVAFSPDGKLIATSGNDCRLRFWEVTSSREILHSPDGHLAPVRAVAYLRRDKRILSVSEDGTARLWDLKSGKSVRIHRHQDFKAPGVRLCPATGRILCARRDGTIAFHDPVSGLVVWKFVTDMRGGASRLAVSEDGRTLLTWWDADQRLRSYDTAAGKPRVVWNDPGWCGDLTVSPDGRHAVTFGHPILLRRWREPGPNAIQEEVFHSNHLLLAYSPDARTYASAGESISIFDGISGTWLRQGKQLPEGVEVHSLAYSPDGRLLATGDTDGDVRIWEVASGQQRVRLHGHRGTVSALSFSPDGRFLLSGGWDSRILAWDLQHPDGDFEAKTQLLPERVTWTLWKNLVGDDPEIAFRALLRLSSAGESVVPFILTQVHRRWRRNQVEIPRWIADLDHKDFARRQQASEVLARLGDHAENQLQLTLTAKPSVEQKRRILALLHRLERETGTPEQIAGGRVIELLEKIGSKEARRGLQSIASDVTSGWLRREAEFSLSRWDRSHKPALE